jgi:hypothetical protein
MQRYYSRFEEQNALDVVVFNSILGVLKDRKLFQLMDEYLAKMKAANIPYNEYTYSLLIKTCADKVVDEMARLTH